MKKKRISPYSKVSSKKVSNKAENRGKIIIPETKINPPMSAGSHKLLARQKEHGIVKKKKRKRLESIEHFMKKRKLGERP